jgi:arylsulfatase A-like enzyme
MSGALLRDSQPQHPFLYWEFFGGGFQQAARMDAWKALRMGPNDPLELYNLEADPGEQHNIASRHPEVVARMKRYLATARTDSPLWPAPSEWQSWSRRIPRQAPLALALLAVSTLVWIGFRYRSRSAAARPPSS